MRAASWDYTDGPRRWDHRDLGDDCGYIDTMSNCGHGEARMLVRNPRRVSGTPGTTEVDIAGFCT